MSLEAQSDEEAPPVDTVENSTGETEITLKPGIFV